MATKHHHVLMFPWLAFGHILPFLEFSKRLAAKGIHISFVSTPRNIQRLPSIPPNLANHINLLQIPLPSVQSLPDCAEATIDIPIEQVQYLKKAYDELQVPFEILIAQISPDLIVFDFVPDWIPKTASKFGIPSAFFSVFSAATLVFLGPPAELKSNYRTKPEEFTIAPEWFPFTSTVAFPLYQAIPICRNLNVPDVSGKSSGDRLATTLESCDFVLVRGCREFEGEYMNLLQELYKKPVLPIGSLSPHKNSSNTNETQWCDTFKWLDKQPSKSVVFVGFGSEYKLTINQIHELALGLELSELPFIWALKKPEGIDDLELFPCGFQDRTTARGLVCIGWVPQLKMLAHPAIGGCLFHSGWGSIIESLSYGHALILLSMMADQGLNAKLLVEKGVGLEVERNEDGSFTRDAIAKSMRLVMVEREGEPIRLKAEKMRTIFANQDLHENYIDRFVQYLDCYQIHGQILHKE